MMDMDYSDFCLELHSEGTKTFKVKAHSDAYGLSGAAEEMELHLDQDSIAELLGQFEAMLMSKKLYDPNSSALEALNDVQQRFGETLHDSLFHGDVKALYQRYRGRLDDDPGQGLRLRIVWEDGNSDIQPLAALPWELLYGGERDGFLGQRRRFPICRTLLGFRPVLTLQHDQPLKILLVEANPIMDHGSIDAAEEKAMIRRAFKDFPEVVILEADPDLEIIRDRIKSEDISVLHFMGHGGFELKSGEGRIVMADAENLPVRHSAEEFADQLQDLMSLKLVVLSSCWTTTLPRKNGQNLFDTMAPALLRANLAAVVGMQFPILNDSATEFSRRFYTCLAQGEPVDVAAAEGRRALSQLKSNPVAGTQWSLPVVYLAGKDGRILNTLPLPEPQRPAAAPASEPEVPADSLSIGIRSFAKGPAEGLDRRVDRFLSLDDHFDGRVIREPDRWNDAVRLELIEFLERLRPETRTLDLQLFIHSSLAFTAGWTLPVKTGLRLNILQRNPQTGKTVRMSASQGDVPEGRLWNVEHLTLNPQAKEVACAVSLTHSVIQDVVAFAQDHCPNIGRIIHVFPVGDRGHQAASSGAHSFHLAGDLTQILQERSLDERLSPLHLFMACPNVFSFFLGQHSHVLGKIQLYEYPFGENQPGVYWPSVALPPARD